MGDDDPRSVWTSLPITHWDPCGTLYFNTGCACFPWFLSFGKSNPKLQGGWCKTQPPGR
jgi:hypothetical protein